MEGCTEIADGGQCDFRVCCSKGCQRQLCAKHMVPDDEDVEDDAFKNKVCTGCEKRANRAFWTTIFAVLFVPIMAALPAIIFYGGDEI